MLGSVGERIGHCRRGEYTYPSRTGGSAPLAVAALEDKIVQRAALAVLNAIYEEDFLGFPYGFQPWRGAHDALDALIVGINSTKVNWMLRMSASNMSPRSRPACRLFLLRF